jgi:hypothetical protein
MTITRQSLEAVTQVLASDLRARIEVAFGKKIGFCLLMFDMGEKGFISYASNAERDGMMNTLREVLATWEAGVMTDPPGPRGTS